MASTISGAQQVVNETKMGGGGRASSMLGLASAGMAAAGKWASNNPNALGGFAGRLGTVAKGAGLVGLAAGGMKVVQDVGEEVQKYQQLGSVQGGDYQTGMKYEAQARLLALNPFITTQQARQAMQMALSEGFRGGDYDTIQDYMLNNFKDLGVQFSTSMDYARQALYSGASAGDAAKSSRNVLETMYQLSQDGGASFPQRQQQGLELKKQLTDLGASDAAANRAVLGAQEGYGDKKVLQDSIEGITAQAAASPMLMQLAANKLGVNNLMPGALVPGLEEAGFDTDELMEISAGEIAKYVKDLQPRANRIAAFQKLMGQQGVQLTYPQAEALLDKVTGDKKPSQVANEKIASKGEGRRNIDWNPFTYIGGILSPTLNAKSLDDFKNIPRDTWNAITGWEESPQTKAEADDFAKAGRAPVPPPRTAQDVKAQQSSLRTEGTVQGEVRITVDQQGRVTAPQSIQLSGQQKSVNAGYGSAQLNNAPPGDPIYHNAFDGWGNR